MRIVEVRLDGSDQGMVELHPELTVLRGIQGEARERFLEAVRAFSRGVVPEVTTVVAIHDLLVEVTPRVLAVLDLDQGLDPVVRDRTDLPDPTPVEAGHDSTEARALAARAAVAHDRRKEAAAAVERAAAAVAEAERSVGRRREDLARLEPDGARHRVDQARRRLHEAEEARAQVGAVTGSGLGEDDSDDALRRLEVARAAHEQALVRVEEAERIRAGVRDATRSEPFDPDPYDSRITELRRHADELAARIAELPAVDPEPLRRALADLAAAEPPPGPVPEMEEDPPAVVEARLEVEEASRALADSEEAAQPLRLDPDDVAELEAAHTELEEAEERADRALAGPMTRRRVNQARKRLDVVLERLGLPSYGAFLLRSSVVDVDEQARHDVQAARFRLHAARAALAEAEEQATRDRARAELAAEEEHRRRTEQIHREATERVTTALAEAGGPTDDPDLAGAAQRFLDQLEDAHRRRASLVADQARVLDTLAAVEQERAAAEQAATEAAREEEVRAAEELDRAEQDLSEARAESERAAARLEEVAAALTEHQEEVDRRLELRRAAQAADQQLDDARHDLEEAEAQLRAVSERVESARSALSRAERELEQAHGTHAEAVRRLEEVDAGVTGPGEAGGSAPDADAGAPGEASGVEGPAEELEVYLLSRLAAQRAVGRAGSLPIVLDRVLDTLQPDDRAPTLRLLQRMAPSIQVVIISDDDRLADWAHEMGIARAVVTSPGATHASAPAQT